MKTDEQGVLISGIVADRNFQPYIHIVIDGHIAQLTMAQARTVARQIEVQCGRIEADAMIHRFFADQSFPREASNALMVSFRDFRSKLDAEAVETEESDPDDDQ